MSKNPRNPFNEAAFHRLKIGAHFFNGTLITVEDYKLRFERDLIGVWSTSSAWMSPTDVDLQFSADGTGMVAESMFGSAGTFEWRQSRLQEMEIRTTSFSGYSAKAEDDESEFQAEEWSRISWFFSAPQSETPQRTRLWIQRGRGEEKYPKALNLMTGSPFTFAGMPT
jgi:hypothetical protein